jgi:hypothetical protein
MSVAHTRRFLRASPMVRLQLRRWQSRWSSTFFRPATTSSQSTSECLCLNVPTTLQSMSHDIHHVSKDAHCVEMASAATRASGDPFVRF